MANKYSFKSPIGNIVIEADQFLRKLYFSDEVFNQSNPVIEQTIIQLKEYFNKKRKSFDLPVKLESTEFGNKVLEAINNIEYGQTKTYKDISEEIAANSAQAIGNACGRNPIAIIIPCHRVVAKSSIGGYAYGLDAKKSLLSLES